MILQCQGVRTSFDDMCIVCKDGFDCNRLLYFYATVSSRSGCNSSLLRCALWMVLVRNKFSRFYEQRAKGYLSKTEM
jgi:hypothetical protein